MKQKFEAVATAATMVVLVVAGLFADPITRLCLWSCVIGVGLRHILIGAASRYFIGGVTALAIMAAPVQAQYRDAPTYAGEPYDYAASVVIMLPDPNHPRGAQLPVIPVAICVGVFVGIVGWLGVKVLRGVIDVHEKIVTNNAAQPAVVKMPVSLPEGPCPSTFDGATDLPGGFTAAMLIDHSPDGTNWVTVSRGVTIGSTVVMPDTGFLRLRPLALSMEIIGGQPILHAPPGFLECSNDLKNWSTISDNYVDTDVQPEPGMFYRVRL